MKAWQFTGKHKPLSLVEMSEPAPSAGEVLIDIRRVGLCHSDVGIMTDDLFAPMLTGPQILGHEIAGVIRELGEGATGWKVGDRVGISLTSPQTPGLARDGGYTAAITAATDVLVRIPDAVSFEQAAIGTDAGMTAHYAVRGLGQAGPGTKLGLIGVGGLGQIALRVAALVGCEVYAAELKRDVWPLARELGAKRVVSAITELADEQLDVIIDFAGFGDTTAAAILAVRPGGRVVQVGMGVQEATISTQALVMKQVTLLGCLGGRIEDTIGVYDLMSTGELKPEVSLIEFDEIPDGLERLHRGEVVGRLVARISD